jgi:hypothetical protein
MWKQMLGKILILWRSRCTFKRIITDEQEGRLVDQVATAYLDKPLFSCDEDFRVDPWHFSRGIRDNLEERALLTAKGEAELRVPEFKTSGTVIQDFPARHRMCLRRPSMTPMCCAIEAEMAEFVRPGEEVTQRVPPERITTIDETDCRSPSPGFPSRAPGVKSVSCEIENDEK